jgi:phosphomannomutase
MIGVSGVRGVIGESLTPEVVTRFSMAFGTFLKRGTVVVGRDTRVSGPMVKHAVTAGLLASGCGIIDVDIASTPACGLSIVDLGADGGVVITGSHNPAEWNALKFFKRTGICLNDAEGHELLLIYCRGDFDAVACKDLKPGRIDTGAGERHVKKVLSVTDVDAIRRRRPRVVLDACNGAGSVMTPGFLEALGCEAVLMNCEPNGLFPHDPEPIRENIGDLCRKVREAGADVGFAQDADADRVAVVDENGTCIGEEYSLAIAAAAVFPVRPGKAVVNLSTSRMIEDVAKRCGCEVVRSKVGEVHVAEKMIAERAVIGGEGNGGVIDPRVHLGRDSLGGMALVLGLMAGTGRKISEIVADIPHYYMKKVKIECTRDAALELVRRSLARFAGQRINAEDGVRIDWDDAWVHVRPSNTEPAVRIMAEARTEARVEEICETFERMAKEILA